MWWWVVRIRKGFGAAKRLCSFDFVKFLYVRNAEKEHRKVAPRTTAKAMLSTQVESNIPHVLNGLTSIFITTCAITFCGL